MLTNGRGCISEAEGVEGGGGHDEDGTHCWNWCMWSFPLFQVPGVMSNYRREGVCMQLRWDETLLVKTTAAKMEKSSRTYTLQINSQINKQSDSDFD